MRLTNFIIILFVFVSSSGVGQELYTRENYQIDAVQVWKNAPFIESGSKSLDEILIEAKSVPHTYRGVSKDSIRNLVLSASYYFLVKNKVKEILSWNKLLIEYPKQLNSQFEGVVNLKIGEAYKDLRNYKLAKLYYEQAFNKELGEELHVYCASEIGLMNKELGDYQEAIQYYTLALQEASHPEIRTAQVNSIGFLHYLSGDLNNAEKYFKMALDTFSVLRTEVDSVQYYNVQSNLLSLALKRGDLKSAGEIVNQLQSRDGKREFEKWLRIEVYSKSFDYYYEVNDCTEMRRALLMLEEAVPKLDKSIDKLGLISKKWLYESACGSKGLARKYAQLYISFRDSIDKQEQMQRSSVELIQIENYRERANLATQNLLLKSEAQTSLEASNFRLKVLFYLSALIFVLVVVILIITLRNKKKRQERREHYLNVKRTLVEEQKKAVILQGEANAKALENKRLELRNMIQGAELEGELIQELIERLNSIRKNGDEGELVQLVQFLQSKQKARKLDEVLSMHQDLVDLDFKTKVKERFSDLTDAEFQLMIMLRIGLTTKEIALFRNIEPASVRIYKNRLKNKLNLDKQDDLEQFIASF